MQYHIAFIIIFLCRQTVVERQFLKWPLCEEADNVVNAL
jgi:hypothetical protein